MDQRITKPAEQWQEILRESGYKHFCNTQRQFKQLQKLPRTWRIILKTINLHPPAKILEIVCGGGIHLVQLALNGFTTAGIDVSPEVLARALDFIESVMRYDRNSLANIELALGDFLTIDLGNNSHPLFARKYDLVFNVGVIEHYLDKNDREEFLARMLRLTKTGGFVVSIVPSGLHPYRDE